MIYSGQIVDIINEKIFPGELVVENGRIMEIKKVAKADNVFVVPGLIDAHIHIESSMLVPSRFAQLAVTHGTVATVSDPHEIANVLGIDGINYMIWDGKFTPFKFFWTVPSCVPATDFEINGATLDATDVGKLLKRPNFVALSEMMNYPGVINRDQEIMAKIQVATEIAKPIDGHAPLLTGQGLTRYVEAGITTDHESISSHEAEEKIKLGMKIWAREGSAAKNLDSLISVLKKYPDQCGLCSDDLHPDDLYKGHINLLVKRLLEKKFDLYQTLKLASYNVIKHYNLPVGLLQSGDWADFIMINNIDEFKVIKTVINGKVVAKNNKATFKPRPKKIKNNFCTQQITRNQIQIKSKKETKKEQIKGRVIEAIDQQLITKESITSMKVNDNKIDLTGEGDVLKIVICDRYGKNMIKTGLIKNFGLHEAAVAQTVAHDSHNIIAVGDNDKAIVKAINEIIKIRGGCLLIKNNRLAGRINLTVAGLMSTRHGKVIAKKYKQLKQQAKKAGAQLRDPFMTLSFMALPVIPELKMTARGLFQSQSWQFVDVLIDE
ncbi:MAG TPA: adenine deaminase [bacterium]|nr:adenine deaminase [bacterium]